MVQYKQVLHNSFPHDFYISEIIKEEEHQPYIIKMNIFA